MHVQLNPFAVHLKLVKCKSTMLLLLLLRRFSRVRLCATTETAAHQAPPSLGFSRQEHWSGLPFPSPVRESEKWKGSHSVVSDSQRPHGLQPTRLLCPWIFQARVLEWGAIAPDASDEGCCILLNSQRCTERILWPSLNSTKSFAHSFSCAKLVTSRLSWNFLGVQWLRLHASNAVDTGLIPGLGTKIPHAKWSGQK